MYVSFYFCVCIVLCMQWPCDMAIRLHITVIYSYLCFCYAVQSNLDITDSRNVCKLTVYLLQKVRMTCSCDLPHGPLFAFLSINIWNEFANRKLVAPGHKSFPRPDELSFIKSTVNFNRLVILSRDLNERWEESLARTNVALS